METFKEILPLAGACCFGIIVGWYVYYTNRHRKDEVSAWGDLTALIGVIGGAAVLALFPQGSPLFGAYGVGLVLGFFGYYASLKKLVKESSGKFGPEYFIDGRRKKLADDEYIPTREEQSKGAGAGMVVKPAEQTKPESMPR